MKNHIIKLSKAISKCFCKHDFAKMGFHQECENGVRYSVRHYECKKCHKKILVDGRNDKYEKHVA